MAGTRGRVWTAGVLLLSMAGAPSLADAQLISTVVNRDGVALSCVTVGPLATVAQDYCVRRTQAQGFVLKRDLGTTGLTLEDAADRAARVAAVAPGSPAALAGVDPGDALVAVGDQAVRRSPADVGRQLLFGRRGEPVRLTLIREGTPVEVRLVRSAAPEPPDAPHSPNILVGVHPVMNWRGEFIPCMGAGVLGPAVVAACLGKYGHAGFVQTSALGTTGLDLADPAQADGTALVAAIAPGLPSAAADVRVGDRLNAVDGRPLTASAVLGADALLFGKAGDVRRLVLQRGSRTYTASLTLAGRP